MPPYFAMENAENHKVINQTKKLQGSVKPKDLNSTLESTWRKERTDFSKLPCDIHMCHIYTGTHSKCKKKIFKLCKKINGAEMPQQLRALAFLTEDPGSVLSIHMPAYNCWLL